MSFYDLVRFELLITLTMKITFFWDVINVWYKQLHSIISQKMDMFIYNLDRLSHLLHAPIGSKTLLLFQLMHTIIKS